MIPTLTLDGESILLGGVTLSPAGASVLRAELGNLVTTATDNTRARIARENAATIWAQAEARPGTILGRARFGAGPEVEALIRNWLGRWEAITRDNGLWRRCEVVSVPPMLVRAFGARTRHWWTGGRQALCGKALWTPEMEAGGTRPVCEACAAKRGGQ